MIAAVLPFVSDKKERVRMIDSISNLIKPIDIVGK